MTLNKNNSMPLSPIANGQRRLNPEWYGYLRSAREAIALLQTLTGGIGGTDVLTDRLAALSARVNALVDAVANQHERLVIAKVKNTGNGGTRAHFAHNLGTPHVFWHIWNPVNGQQPSDYREFETNNASYVEFRDSSFDPLSNDLEGIFIGVISDRY